MEAKIKLENARVGQSLFAAYGDVLGAPQEGQTEPTPPPWPARLPRRDMPAVPNPWGTWLTRELITKAAGVPTDDTSTRLLIVEPWREQLTAQAADATEESFLTFIRHLAGQPLAAASLQGPRDQQIRDWLEMAHAQATQQSACFYVPGRPVTFGMFLYGPVAGELPSDFASLYEFCRFDVGYARFATALFLRMLQEALALSPQAPEEVGAWFGHSIEAIFSEAAALPQRSIHQDLNRFERLWEKGLKGVDGTIEVMFAPALVWAQIIAAVKAYPEDPLAIMRKLAFGTGDTDTVASFWGQLAGAFLGADRLYRIDPGLSADLDVLCEVLKHWYRVDLRRA